MRTGAGTASGKLGLCYQLGAGTVTNFGGDYHEQMALTTTMQLYGVSAAVTGLPAGTYTIGVCIDDLTATVGGISQWTSGFFQVLPPGTASNKGGGQRP